LFVETIIARHRDRLGQLVDSLPTGRHWSLLTLDAVGLTQFKPEPMQNLNDSIRSSIRAAITANGPSTCTEIVSALGLDARNCKRSIHAIMVDMEQEGILGATRQGKTIATMRRHQWFLWDAPRKRDRLRAILMGL
jgi:hypothetical protein